MHEALVVSVLQGGSHLGGIGNDTLEWNARPLWVQLSQAATGCVFHDEKGRAVVDGEIEHAHNMWVVQARKRLRFLQELFGILFAKLGAQDFESGVILEICMLS